jgi:membrane-associated protease RseP (regulator of RpoE activity)
MSFALGVVIFIVALLISIMLHELGHFLTAKAFRMKVTQFFVGFGNTLWSRQVGETEYGIKSIPVGGYVKIVGMTGLDEVDPTDEPRTFRRKPGWQRLIVMAAGSFMHFAVAFVLLVVLAAAVGLATPGSGTRIGTIDPCVPASVKATTCTTTDSTSPAKRVGLRAGDTIIAIAGKPARNWTAMGALIREQPAGRPVAVTVERDGHRLTVHPSLAVIPGRSGSYLGIAPVIVYHPMSPISALGYAGSTFAATVQGSVHVISQLPAAIPDLFAKNRAATPAGQVTSVVGAGDVTGQVLAANIGWQPKLSLVLVIIASLNIFVGLFNLLPLLPLDGGHIAIVLYERARATIARLRGRPDPGLVNFQRLIPVSIGVFAVLIGFGLLLIMADLVNPVHILQ